MSCYTFYLLWGTQTNFTDEVYNEKKLLIGFSAYNFMSDCFSLDQNISLSLEMITDTERLIDVIVESKFVFGL